MAAEPRPNVLFIAIDDLGKRVGTKSHAHDPVLEKLATTGVRSPPRAKTRSLPGIGPLMSGMLRQFVEQISVYEAFEMMDGMP